MASNLEYHIRVRHSILAPVARFGLIAVPVFLLAFLMFAVTASPAQVNGAPASVTSPGFGGRAVNGPPASVTSLGPRGYSGPRASFSGTPVAGSHDGNHPHRHHGEYPAAVYAVPVPYAVDPGAADYDNGDDSDSDYQGGPTIFDRRGSGAESYVPPVRNISRPDATDPGDSDSAAPDPPQVPTLLVFKDGHKLEVGNYAIVGATLFDLTPGHARKVPVADLDLDATVKQNDDRGVIFQLPAISQAN